MDALPLRAFRVAGRCHSGRDRPKALQLRRDGSYCRLADDLDSRSAEQRSYMGLSLLLVARRLFCRAGAEPAWGNTHNGRFSSLHHQHCGSRQGSPPPPCLRKLFQAFPSPSVRLAACLAIVGWVQSASETSPSGRSRMTPTAALSLPPRRCSLIAAYHEWATGRCLRVLRNSGSRRQCWHSSQMLAYGSSEVGCASTPSQVRCVGRPATGWRRLLASSAFPSGLAIGARRRTGSAPLSSIRDGIQSRTLSSRV